MKVILGFIFSFYTTLVLAQTDPDRGRQFELKGKLIGKVSLPPDCGIIAWATVIEFEVIEFSDSDYKTTTIPVIFACPEFYKSDFFQVGQVYTVTVGNEKSGGVIMNESILEKYNLKDRLWAIKAEKIK
jgi:hypothetical protein